MMKGRAKDLEKTIKQPLDDQSDKLIELLYEHPLIYSLFLTKEITDRFRQRMTQICQIERRSI